MDGFAVVEGNFTSFEEAKLGILPYQIENNGLLGRSCLEISFFVPQRYRKKEIRGINLRKKH